MSARLDDMRCDVRQAHILSGQPLSEQARASIPASWAALHAIEDPEARVATQLGAWAPFTSELHDTIGVLRRRLRDVELIHTSRGYALLYCLQDEAHEWSYDEGMPPGAPTDERVAALFERLPEPLRRFYEPLHAGSTHFASRAMGPRPLDDLCVMGALEWGILETIGPSPIDLDRSLSVLVSGGSGSLCAWLPEDGSPLAHLWFTNREPRQRVEPWPTLDAWMVMGFE